MILGSELKINTIYFDMYSNMLCLPISITMIGDNRLNIQFAYIYLEDDDILIYKNLYTYNLSSRYHFIVLQPVDNEIEFLNFATVYKENMIFT